VHFHRASGRKATEKKLVFLIDFQTRAHPAYQETVKRVQAGEIGKIVSVDAAYCANTPSAAVDDLLRAKPSDPEVRLRAWNVDNVLSGTSSRNKTFTRSM